VSLSLCDNFNREIEGQICWQAPIPDGPYLIKGGGAEVWKLFGIRKEHRCSQGIIHGKRCGVTENIGQAARRRWGPERLQQGEKLTDAAVT